ncbi:MAG: dihydroxy-acid dehydratase [Desulfarculaceae bacterium]|nr:dihydroxy-acid dehydratase [Desulfarculaceae bacterium]MCF8073572.1 dihydroxy-acid dehydratase [Desulfarculaceae bacterium]MCF8103094.1 dihydroxy-acid dehydratase [Desulfarculaceae bacterium]MCF8115712.1 dihydroxy-acid dehydratase [Desulfarculaceae bacterium]
MTRRNKDILEGPRWAKVRALMKSMGHSDYDLERPIIGVANTYSNMVPGHFNLKQVAESVKQGIYQAGGTPMEFGVVGCCDGVANGHLGMRYILPSREVIAGSVEVAAQAHRLDAVVLLGSCDKIVPGLLMAAARLDLPAILVNGGPSLGGCSFDGRPSDITSLTEGVGMLAAGKITEQEFAALENAVMPTCGSCSFLGTANSMGCAAEGLGLCLPGTATIPAVHSARLIAAQAAGRRIVAMVDEDLNARKIINRAGLENAVRLGLAMGGSTNLVLHLLAVAYEAEVDMGVEIFEELSQTTPHLAKIYPSAAANVPDFHAAGGVPALQRELLPLLNGGNPTVSGQSVAENVANATKTGDEIIRSLDDPWSSQGGLAVLRGNLAPATAVTKPAAIDPAMHRFTGTAHCFDSEDEANQAIMDQRIKPGEVVVIRYEGPKGGPGMPEMAMAMKMLYGQGLAKQTALITDGRFSGTNNGCFVGHISPEAAEGGPLAAVRDGDRITVDIAKRRVDLELSDQEIAARLAQWKRPAPKIARGYLALYSRLAASAARGAIIPTRDED